MRPSSIATLLAALACLAGVTPGDAGELSVTPVTIAATAPTNAATLTLRNLGQKPINAQIRVFRWSQEGGVEKLERTSDVVVSPPITSLPPRVDYLVRVVRVAKTPVAKEESYRILVDEIPDRGPRENGTVTLMVRYSIPVFFAAGDAAAASVAWRLERADGGLRLAVRNNGAKHLRLANVRIKDKAGAIIPVQDGLVGYVLGGAAMAWPLTRINAGSVASGQVELIADSGSGPVHAPLSLSAPR